MICDKTMPAAPVPVCGSMGGAAADRTPLAVPCVPVQPRCSKRYPHNEALNNGTLFPALDLPYHLKAEARNVVCCPLNELQALDFVLAELGLYLDTHPCDAEALDAYKQYAALEKELRTRYEAVHGPLCQSSAASDKSWNAWLRDPWPWDSMEGGK